MKRGRPRRNPSEYIVAAKRDRATVDWPESDLSGPWPLTGQRLEILRAYPQRRDLVSARMSEAEFWPDERTGELSINGDPFWEPKEDGPYRGGGSTAKRYHAADVARWRAWRAERPILRFKIRVAPDGSFDIKTEALPADRKPPLALILRAHDMIAVGLAAMNEAKR